MRAVKRLWAALFPGLCRPERGSGFEVCVHRPPRGAPADERTLLYLLPGACGGPCGWGRSSDSRRFYQSLQARGVAGPVVVSVSFGDVWLLTEGALLDRFLTEAMPFVESRLGVPDRRLLWGVSMGAFNASQLLLKRPELWAGGALVCPALPTLPPGAGPAELEEYLLRTGADPSNVEWMLGVANDAFRGPEQWARHDPIRLARQAAGLPPVLVQCGDSDEYGFFEGATRFAEALESSGRSVKLSRLNGGRHNDVDVEEVAAFVADRLSRY